MKDKFKNVPVDDETDIQYECLLQLDQYIVKYEIWNWDGYNAESILFETNDVQHLNQSEIENLVKKLPIYKPESGITFNTSKSGYTFVNFNFWVKD